MRGKLCFCVVLLLIACIVISGCGGKTSAPTASAASSPAAQVSQKAIELSFSTLFPGESLQNTRAIEIWLAEIEKRTQGRVKINRFYLSPLFPFDEAYTSLIAGMASTAEIDLQAHPGVFPMHEVIHITRPSQGYAQYGRIMNDLEKKFPNMNDELSKVKYLFSWSMGPAVICSNKPVRKLEDTTGLKLAAIGDLNCRFGNALGLSMVSLPPTEVYTSTDKGVVDGVLMTSDCLISWRMGELVKYVTNVSISSCLFIMAMNQKTWDSLPPDIQKTIDEVSAWAVDYFDQAFFKVELDSLAYAKQKGIEVIELPAGELARWDPKVKSLHEEYVATLNKRGLPGQNLLDEYLKLVDQKQMK